MIVLFYMIISRCERSSSSTSWLTVGFLAIIIGVSVISHYVLIIILLMTDDVGHFSCACLLSVYFFSEMFVLFWFFKNWVMCFLFSEDRLLYVFWTQVLY